MPRCRPIAISARVSSSSTWGPADSKSASTSAISRGTGTSPPGVRTSGASCFGAPSKKLCGACIIQHPLAIVSVAAPTSHIRLRIAELLR